jgi:hypothetical protein
MLAEAGGLPRVDVARIALGGFLRDLGKVGVPDAILNKRDALSLEEYEIVKTHPVVGAWVLSGHPLGDLIRPAVLSHHERVDGGGYAGGLAAPQISPDARIACICDAFDAVTSARPYRRGRLIAMALAIIGDHLGSQFDRPGTGVSSSWGTSRYSLMSLATASRELRCSLARSAARPSSGVVATNTAVSSIAAPAAGRRGSA